MFFAPLEGICLLMDAIKERGSNKKEDWNIWNFTKLLKIGKKELKTAYHENRHFTGVGVFAEFLQDGWCHAGYLCSSLPADWLPMMSSIDQI